MCTYTFLKLMQSQSDATWRGAKPVFVFLLLRKRGKPPEHKGKHENTKEKRRIMSGVQVLRASSINKPMT